MTLIPNRNTPVIGHIALALLVLIAGFLVVPGLEIALAVRYPKVSHLLTACLVIGGISVSASVLTAIRLLAIAATLFREGHPRRTDSPQGFIDTQIDFFSTHSLDFSYSFLGTILGSIVGSAAGLWLAAFGSDGNTIALGFALMSIPIFLVVGAILGLVLSLRVLHSVRRNGDDATAKSKNMRTVSVPLGACVAFVSLMLWGTHASFQPPSDQELLNNFHQHRAAFDEMASMAQAYPDLEHVDTDETVSDDTETVTVPPQQIKKFRHLLKTAAIVHGFQPYGEHDELDFFFWAEGSAMSDDTIKGYAYRTSPPDKVWSSLNQCDPSEKPNDRVKDYRHIEGNWYLYYDYIPE